MSGGNGNNLGNGTKGPTHGEPEVGADFPNVVMPKERALEALLVEGKYDDGEVFDATDSLANPDTVDLTVHGALIRAAVGREDDLVRSGALATSAALAKHGTAEDMSVAIDLHYLGTFDPQNSIKTKSLEFLKDNAPELAYDRAEELLASESAMICSTAIRVLAEVAPKQRVTEVCEGLVDDERPAIAALAAVTLDAQAEQDPGESKALHPVPPKDRLKEVALQFSTIQDEI